MIGRQDLFFSAPFTFHTHAPLFLPSSSVSLSYFILAVPIHECWKTLAHEFHSSSAHEFLISYSHTEWYLIFFDCATTRARCVLERKSRYTSPLVRSYWWTLLRWPTVRLSCYSCMCDVTGGRCWGDPQSASHVIPACAVLQVDVAEVTALVARDSERKGLHEDAIRLYDLAKVSREKLPVHYIINYF